MNIHFILWVIFQYYNYLIGCFYHSSFGYGRVFKLLLCPFDMLSCSFVSSASSSFLTPPPSMASQDAWSSYHIFPAQVLKSTISARNPDFFYWRTISRDQDLIPGCVHCYCDVTAVEINETSQMRISTLVAQTASACNVGDLGFNPRVRKIPWRREWQPNPVFFAWIIPWTEKPDGPQSVGLQKSQTQLSN